MCVWSGAESDVFSERVMLADNCVAGMWNAMKNCLAHSNALHINPWYQFWGRIPARKQGTKNGDGLSVSKFAGPKSDPDYGPRSGPTFGSRTGTPAGVQMCYNVPLQHEFASRLEHL